MFNVNYFYFRNEFSRTYIQIEEELKMQVIKLKAKNDRINNLLIKLKTEAQKFKNEIMIEDEIAENGKLFFSVVSVNFKKINKNYENIFIKFIYRNEIKMTSILSNNNNLIWNEKFE